MIVMLTDRVNRRFCVSASAIAIFVSFVIAAPAAAYPAQGVLAVSAHYAFFKDGMIEASFTVKNISDSSQKFFPNLSIEKPGVVTKATHYAIQAAPSLIWTEAGAPEILLPGEEKQVSFGFKLGTHLASSKYDAVLRLLSEAGESLGTTSPVEISLNGDNSFLWITRDDCKIVRDGNEFDSWIAPPFAPNAEPQTKCQIRNTSSAPLRVRTIFYTNFLSAFQNPLGTMSVSEGPEVFLAPKETKEINLTLPKESAPQVYESAMQFVDAKDKDILFSPIVPLRWTITGKAARIVSATLDKNYYGPSETASVKISYFGSPDFFWDNTELDAKGEVGHGTALHKLSADVQIVDKRGVICGSAKEPLPPIDSAALQTKIVSAAISAPSGCADPSVAAKIINGNDVLSKVDSNVPPAAVQPGVAAGTAANYAYVVLKILAALALLAILGAAGYFALVRKKSYE